MGIGDLEFNKDKKVAIVGCANSTRHMAPFDDESFEIWGCCELGRFQEGRWTRYFEIHKWEDLVIRQYENIEWLAKQTFPIYMQEHFSDIPCSKPYPVNEAVSMFGKEHFTSTVPYMVAMALMEGFGTIHLYGIDMAGETEWSYQRPSAQYFVGLIRGLGLDLHIPSESKLFSGAWFYGYDDEPASTVPVSVLRPILENLQAARVKVRQQELKHEGAIEIVKHIIGLGEATRRVT